MEPIEPKPVESKKTPWARNVLLVVVLVAVAAFFVLPALQRPSDSGSRLAHTRNNMLQIALALLYYESVHGALPPTIVTDDEGNPLYSWRVLILRELEQPVLYEQFDFAKPWDSPENHRFIEQMPSIYQSPYQDNERTEGLTAYQALVEEGDEETLFLPTRGRRLSGAPSGLSNTALIVEELHQPVVWTKPDDISPSEFLAGLGAEDRLTEYASFVTGDGAAHRLKRADRDELLPFMYANDGEVPE